MADEGDATGAEAPQDDVVLRVQELVKDYGELRAVDRVSFEVQRGEVFSLLGPNGAGKTTTTEVLETLRRPTKGTVEVLGLDVLHASEAIRARIGVMPQDFRAYDLLTSRENVAYFASMYRSSTDPDELLELVGMADRADQRYEELSGGLKQRLGIAIALVNEPEVVFLDEPTTGLDPRARRDVWEVVQQLAREGRTVFLTTHYMEEAHVLADRVAIMDRGRIVDLDRPGRLVTKHAPGQTVLVHDGLALQERFGDDLEVEAVEGDLLVHVRDDAELSQVLGILTTVGGHGGFEVRSGTLEDVFLTLTGRGLAGDAEVRA